MCGIVGVLGGEEHINRVAINEMSYALRHRGPDSDGIWKDISSEIFLGHRRLSILDVSSRGNQPMISKSGRYIIAFNGEIYNHLDLRKQLDLTYNPLWESTSDTETLLNGFDNWGIKETMKKSIGMFAISVWDTKEKVLILIRDRTGEKPLYYGYQGIGKNKVMLFSSELKALRKHKSFQSDISLEALDGYLQYNTLQGQQSIYKGIKKVKPGTILYISKDKGVFNEESYWSLDEVVQRGKENIITSKEEAMAGLIEVLESAISDQMISDVPLGAFLSGGIDSSLIVAMMQKYSSKPIKTFSIGFEDERYNEAGYAKDIANFLNTDHQELILTPQDSLDIIPSLSTIYDEPFADSSQIPTILVSKLARKDVTVCLSGDAGDEIFGGYTRYIQTQKMWNLISKLPSLLRRSLPQQLSNNSIFLLNQLGNFFEKPFVGDRLSKGMQLLDSSSGREIYKKLISNHWTKEGVPLLHTENKFSDLTYDLDSRVTFLEGLMLSDTKNYLLNDILTKVDRAAMSVSLEGRIPFLDHRVIEFSWRIPIEQKIDNSSQMPIQKSILRNILLQHVPRHLIDRPKKGFSVPIGDWLRGPLREWAEDLLSAHRIGQDGLLDSVVIRKKWKEHLSGNRNWQSHLWNILIFQQWLHDQKNG